MKVRTNWWLMERTGSASGSGLALGSGLGSASGSGLGSGLGLRLGVTGQGSRDVLAGMSLFTLNKVIPRDCPPAGTVAGV